MPEVIKLLILFAVGLLAGFINVMAGGGSTLTMPMMIFLGLNGIVANGTNRIAIFIQNLSALRSFHLEKAYEFKPIFKMALWTLPGAITGALVAVQINNTLFQRILAFVIIIVVISIFLPSPADKTSNNSLSKNSWLIYPALLAIGFYGGFIQAGVGFLFMAALRHILHFDLVKVNRYKIFMIFIYTIPALFIFAFHGKIDYIYAIVLASGNALGAWWSAKISSRKGEKVIRFVLLGVVILMAAKLLKHFN